MLKTLADLDRLLSPEEIVGRFVEVQGTTEEWAYAICPFHEETRPSLSVNLSTGSWLCWACARKGKFSEIIERVGTPEQRIEAERFQIPTTSYPYRDKDGNLRYVIIRYFPKTFRPFMIQDDHLVSGLDGTPRLLYNLPTILQTPVGQKIWIVEGEKDVETLRRRGLVATTAAGGANGWRPEFAEVLEKFDVQILPDNDEAGQRWLKKVGSSLPAATVRLLPEGIKDVSNLLSQTRLTPLDLPTQSARAVLAAQRPSLTETAHDILRRREEIPAPMLTGIASIDGLGGLRRGLIATVGGYPGNGKSSFLAQLVNGLIPRHRVLVLPFEEKVDIFQRRLLLQRGLIPSLFAEIPEKVLASIADYDRLIFLRDFQDVSPDIDKLMPILEDTISRDQIDVVVVDHLQELTLRGANSDFMTVNVACTRIRDLQRKYNTTWLLASQLRKPFGPPGKILRRPNNFDLKASGRIYDISQAIFLVHRSSDGDTIECSKNRYGKTALLRLDYDTDRLCFME